MTNSCSCSIFCLNFWIHFLWNVMLMKIFCKLGWQLTVGCLISVVGQSCSNSGPMRWQLLKEVDRSWLKWPQYACGSWLNGPHIDQSCSYSSPISWQLVTQADRSWLLWSRWNSPQSGSRHNGGVDGCLSHIFQKWVGSHECWLGFMSIDRSWNLWICMEGHG